MSNVQPPITPDEIAAIIGTNTNNVFTTMLGMEGQAGPFDAQAKLTEDDGKVVCPTGSAAGISVCDTAGVGRPTDLVARACARVYYSVMESR